MRIAQCDVCQVFVKEKDILVVFCAVGFPVEMGGGQRITDVCSRGCAAQVMKNKAAEIEKELEDERAGRTVEKDLG